MPVPEAPLRATDTGVVVEGDGWFVVNVADAQAHRNPWAGVAAIFESREHRFPDFGINVHVLEPGQPNGLYHSESVQEAFLVLSGECLLLVEEEERRLRAWDFVHFPPGTRHVAVGAGDGPCAILMVGARRPDATLNYPVSELAARHDASTSEETGVPSEAYRERPREFVPERMRWPLDG